MICIYILNFNLERRCLILSDPSIDPNILKEINDWLPESTKEKLFNPSAKIIGQGLAGIAYWAFQKPIKYGILKKKEFVDFMEKTVNKTSEIPKENQDISKMGIVLKSFDQATYQMNEPILRDMFSQLIANTVDSRKNEHITTLFPFILGNLSKKDGIFIKKMFSHKVNIIDLAFIKSKNTTYINPFSLWPDKTVALGEYPTMNVLESFGIGDLNLIGNTWAKTPDFRKELIQNLKNQEIYKNGVEEVKMSTNDPAGRFISIATGTFSLTPLGLMFIQSII